jgi:hypothetical protein
MQLALLDSLFAQILIYNVLGDVEALWLKSELAMYIDDPFKKECSACISQLSLNSTNIVDIKHILDLLDLHFLIYVLLEFRNVLWILEFCLIANTHVLLGLTSIFTNSLSELFLYFQHVRVGRICCYWLVITRCIVDHIVNYDLICASIFRFWS